MVKITLDDALISQLHNLDSRLEICDQSGRTLGFFVPAQECDRLLYAWAREQFSDAELDAARSETGGESLAKILADFNNA